MTTTPTGLLLRSNLIEASTPERVGSNPAMAQVSAGQDLHSSQPDPELVRWNDRMYRLHGTPYDRGITRFIQQARVAAVLRLAEVRSNDRVLEIGCESGRLLAQVPACGRLVGADISEAALVDASSHLASRNPTVELVQVDVQRRLPFAPGEFDVVICSEMLEHVVDPRAAVEHLHAAVDRKARVVLSIPIEAPKLAIKRALAAVGLLGLLFPGIEPGRSEWHLHAFSRRMLLEITRGLFRADRSAVVWGCHYVARFAKL